jgi:hypothetical protein
MQRRPSNTINIDQQNPTPEQKAEITSNIKQLTRQYAGDAMNITESPIYSPNTAFSSFWD